MVLFGALGWVTIKLCLNYTVAGERRGGNRINETHRKTHLTLSTILR